MIRYGENGKIKGTWLVEAILSGGLAEICEQDLQFRNHRHHIRDIRFPERSIRDREILERFPVIIHELVRLLYFAENERKLSVPESELGTRIREIVRPGNLSGMTAVLLFEKRMLEISSESDRYFALTVHPDVYDGVPKPEEYFRTLLRTILRYSGEPVSEIRIEIRRDVLSEPSDSGDLSVSYGGTDAREALTEREENVRKNAEYALRYIRKTIDEIDAWKEGSHGGSEAQHPSGENESV